MAEILLFVLIAIFIQLYLAAYTAHDAHTRGHDRDLWFVLVLIFGVLAVLIYLLSRNDTRVPESERLERRTSERLTTTGLYTVAIVLGLITFSIAGTLVSGALYTDRPNWEECDSITIGVSDNEDVNQSDLSDPCVVSDERWEEHKRAEEAYHQRIWFSVLLGLIVPPTGVFFWRNYRA